MADKSGLRLINCFKTPDHWRRTLIRDVNRWGMKVHQEGWKILSAKWSLGLPPNAKMKQRSHTSEYDIVCWQMPTLWTKKLLHIIQEVIVSLLIDTSARDLPELSVTSHQYNNSYAELYLRIEILTPPRVSRALGGDKDITNKVIQSLILLLIYLKI